MTLLQGFTRFRHGTLWTKYASANPREADKISAYIDTLATRPVSPPTLVTDTGEGLVEMLDALATQPATYGYSPYGK